MVEYVEELNVETQLHALGQGIGAIRSDAEEGAGTLSRAIWSGARGAAQRKSRYESKVFSGVVEGLRSSGQAWKI
jgi:hypothetical protein